ncbi:hypothetical protein [Alphaproteobacteria bacterium endosymbiont of Tiliacea citrago]|uniref:hypothetical protein n=1 Tax=Alphaproteobacteria bacterium endosymbiont of Tiliacea citrago TaxID=3077944 RepID=UPI00313B3F7D
MRKIEDLLGFKLNLEIQHELEFQVLFDNRKEKIEEETLLDEYDDSIETVSWESIEISSWDLMKNKGVNWKLFTIWLESLIYIDGWDNAAYCFEALDAILSKKIKILLDEEDRVGCIDFLDKAISRALLLQPIQDEDNLFQYSNYKKINPQKLYDSLSLLDKDFYQELIKINEKTTDYLKKFQLLTREVYIHFAKIYEIFEKLKDILVYYENSFVEEEDDEEDDENNENDKPKKEDSSIKKDKETAFQLISEALELLQEYDKQNISIPLLRKIMRWKESNISEIINEINDKDGAYHILAFLMD